jgi:Mor family transcriptional regulator
MKEGYRQYKLKVKQDKILKDIENNPDYKKCIDCNEYKLLQEYYLSAARQAVRRCKSCYVIFYNDKVKEKMEDKGGKDNYYKDPNKYTSEIQRSQVFMVMELLGWEFDGQVWNKPGLKENGVFINIIPTEKKKIKRPSLPHGRKIKSGVWNNQEKIVKLIDEGHLYGDVAEVYDCSHTLIRSVVSKYRNEKRTD